MKKIVTCALIAMIMCALTAAYAAEKGTPTSGNKDAVATNVNNDQCMEETNPCDWKNPSITQRGVGAMYGGDPTIPEDYRGWRRLYNERGNAKLSEYKYRIKQSSPEHAKRQAGCAALCLMKDKHYAQAEELVEENQLNQIAVYSKALAKNQQEKEDDEDRLDYYKLRHDSAEIDAATARLEIYNKKESLLLSNLKAVGSCDSKKDPWACFKERAAWSDAFGWARKHQDKHLVEAARNVCLEMRLESIENNERFQAKISDKKPELAEYVDLGCVAKKK